MLESHTDIVCIFAIYLFCNGHKHFILIENITYISLKYVCGLWSSVASRKCDYVCVVDISINRDTPLALALA